MASIMTPLKNRKSLQEFLTLILYITRLNSTTRNFIKNAYDDVIKKGLDEYNIGTT